MHHDSLKYRRPRPDMDLILYSHTPAKHTSGRQMDVVADGGIVTNNCTNIENDVSADGHPGVNDATRGDKRTLANDQH